MDNRLKRRSNLPESLDSKKQKHDINENNNPGGLNVEIHPLLRGIAKTPSLPKNHNPIKQNVRLLFDATAINPYLNQEDVSLSGTRNKGRALEFIQKGKYIKQGEKLREKIRREEEESRKIEEEKKKGLVPNAELGEDYYRPSMAPSVEWWDKPYLRDNDYRNIDNEDRIVLDNEVAPVSIYIQHPVLIPPIWENNSSGENKLYLTKKEMKRKRKNERQEKYKDLQDRIKLGLEPPPPPKVKLSNLMNVLTNEAIKDPTAIEMKVKAEVEERYKKHMQANEERKKSKKEIHEKIHEKNLKELSKGYFTTVYKIRLLANPQHLFKIDINAKQLELMGICLKNPKFSLIIVEGGEKNLKFYKKLLTRRIKWTENVAPKAKEQNPEQQNLEDLSHNKCDIIWEGQINDFHFKKWSIMNTESDDEVFEVLDRFGVENYWREALSFDNEQ